MGRVSGIGRWGSNGEVGQYSGWGVGRKRQGRIVDRKGEDSRQEGGG
jgi:hypothetical protein